MSFNLTDLDDSTLESIVTESHDEIGRHLREQGEMVSSYVGPFYEGSYTGGTGAGPSQRTLQTGFQSNPTNTHYAWVTAYLARVAAGVPKWDVSSHIPGHAGQVADALTLGLDRVSTVLKLRRFVGRMATDYAFSFAYASVMMEERPDSSGLLERRESDAEGLWWPVPRHHEPEDAIWDTAVDAWEESEFRGVRKLFSKSSLSAEDGWVMEEVERAALLADERDTQIPERSRRKYRDRDLIAGRVLWFPKLELEDAEEAGWTFDADEKREMEESLDHYGFMLTLGDKGHAGHLKRPEPYFGRPTGPFVMASGVPVPGSTVGLSHLAAIEAQSREMNDYDRAVNKAGRDAKTIVAVEDDGDGLIKTAINEAAHGDAIDMEMVTRDGRPSFAVIDFSTLSQSMYAHAQYLREQYDRVAGTPDPSQGVVTGDATATEITAAVGASDLRLGYHIGQFNAAMGDVGELMAHQMYHREEFSVSLVGTGHRRDRLVAQGPQGPEPALMPVWDGGPEEGISFDDLHIRFNFRSTQHQTDAQRSARGQRMIEMATQVGPVMPQTPWIPWADLLEAVGGYWDEPDLASVMLDKKILAEATKRFTQLQMAESQPNAQLGSDSFGTMLGDQGTFRSRAPGPQASPAPQAPQGPQLQNSPPGAAQAI